MEITRKVKGGGAEYKTAAPGTTIDLKEAVLHQRLCNLIIRASSEVLPNLALWQIYLHYYCFVIM